MKEYVVDVIVEQTYNCTVEAETEKQAQKLAREAWEQRNSDFIDEGIVEVNIVEEVEK